MIQNIADSSTRQSLRALQEEIRALDQQVSRFVKAGQESGIDHEDLLNIGTNSHAQIDTHITSGDAHIASTTNPHTVTLEQAIAAGDVATSVPTFSGTAGPANSQHALVIKDPSNAQTTGVEAAIQFEDSAGTRIGFAGAYDFIGSGTDALFFGAIEAGSATDGLVILPENDLLSLFIGGNDFFSVGDNTVVVDATGTEALLVRKSAGGGDIFTVDTSTPLINANAPVGILGAPSASDESLKIHGPTNVRTKILFEGPVAASDDVPRGARMSLVHADQLTPLNDFAFFIANSSGATNQLIFGGGSTTETEATLVTFNAAPDNSTTPAASTTNERLRIDGINDQMTLGSIADHMQVTINEDSPDQAVPLTVTGGVIAQGTIRLQETDSTSNANQRVVISARARNDATGKYNMMRSVATSATDDTAQLQIGGGQASYLAYSAIDFYTAVNGSTATGTRILGMDVDSLTIGSGAAGVDYSVTFDGETNDGVLTWMEGEDYFKFSDDIFLPGGENIVLDTTTGTKIGTGATQRIGFFGVTPVVQQPTIADANGTLADVTTKFNTLLSELEALGLLANA